LVTRSHRVGARRNFFFGERLPRRKRDNRPCKKEGKVFLEAIFGGGENDEVFARGVEGRCKESDFGSGPERFYHNGFAARDKVLKLFKGEVV
jgi:hypothetical protein